MKKHVFYLMLGAALYATSSVMAMDPPDSTAPHHAPPPPPPPPPPLESKTPVAKVATPVVPSANATAITPAPAAKVGSGVSNDLMAELAARLQRKAAAASGTGPATAAAPAPVGNPPSALKKTSKNVPAAAPVATSELDQHVAAVTTAFLSARASGNDASDSDLIKYIVETSQFAQWNKVPLGERVKFINKVSTSGPAAPAPAVANELDQHVAAVRTTYSTIRTSGNNAPDQVLVEYIVETLGAKAKWDALTLTEKAEFIGKITQ